MPQEVVSSNPMIYNTPSKNSRGLNGTEEFIDDRELAQRKAEAA
nr:kinesin KP1-like [Tanacetum cinerariifolium]